MRITAAARAFDRGRSRLMSPGTTAAPAPCCRIGEPGAFRRTGGRRDFFLVGQWYPKIGVIEPAGVRHAAKARLAARQFHAQTMTLYIDLRFVDSEHAVALGHAILAPLRLVLPAIAAVLADRCPSFTQGQ